VRTIILHGALRERFGESFKLDVETPAIALRALVFQLKGFAEMLREGTWVLVRGDLDHGLDIDETEIHLSFGHCREFHVIPYVAGSGGRGGNIIKAITGYVLMAAGVVIGALTGNVMLGAGIFAFGLQMTINGVSGLLTHQPKANYQNRGAPDQRQSFLFNGAINSNQQGIPVPIVYGRMRVGSVVISAGLTTEAV